MGATHFFPQLLGEGVFCCAYACWRRYCPDERYALKVFHARPDASAHARNEVRVLRALGSHPRITGLVDVLGEGGMKMRVIQDICDGGQLFDRVAKRGRYQDKDAAGVSQQIFDALCFMHGRGVMHRDVKLENVLLVSEECDVEVKLCDFGTAKLANMLSLVPRSRSFVGSDFYLAPELIMQKEYGGEIDIWAAGVTSYAVLCGTLPFFSSDGDLQKTYRKIVDRELEFEQGVWEDVSQLAVDFINRVLDNRQDMRPSAAAMLCHPWIAAGTVKSSV